MNASWLTTHMVLHVCLRTGVTTWPSMIPSATVFLISSTLVVLPHPLMWPCPKKTSTSNHIVPSPAAPMQHTSMTPSSTVCPTSFRAAYKRCLDGRRQGGVWNGSEREMYPKKPEKCCAEVWISSWIMFYILQSCLHSCDAQGKMRIFIF